METWFSSIHDVITAKVWWEALIMSNENEEQIRALVAAKAGIPIELVRPESRLLQDLRIGGDDAAELLQSFSTKYGVNMKSFEFDRYFPSEPNIWSIRKRVVGLKQPGKAELTVRDLVSVANSGKWPDENTGQNHL